MCTLPAAICTGVSFTEDAHHTNATLGLHTALAFESLFRLHVVVLVCLGLLEAKGSLVHQFLSSCCKDFDIKMVRLFIGETEVE